MNIDIADLTEKFLAELEARRAMSLRVSGLTIFYLSVLVRMKSELLDEPEPEEEYIDDFFEEGEDGEFSERALGPIELLEREIAEQEERTGSLQEQIDDLLALLAALRHRKERPA